VQLGVRLDRLQGQKALAKTLDELNLLVEGVGVAFLIIHQILEDHLRRSVGVLGALLRSLVVEGDSCQLHCLGPLDSVDALHHPHGWDFRAEIRPGLSSPRGV
jgi:hypothetical protein